jgi:hypothetical protein
MAKGSMMQSYTLIALMTASLALGACGDDTGGTASDTTGTTGTTDAATTAPTTGSTSDDTAATETGEPVGRGLPEGVSTWKGTAELGSLAFEIEVTITNAGGDLEASITITDDPNAPIQVGTHVFSCTGTHEPTAGLVALAPTAWIVEPEFALLELVGFAGSYDPATKRLSGALVDYAKGGDNVVTESSVNLDLVDGPGEPTVRGDEASSLVVGSQSFTGTSECTGPVRETAGSIEYDGAGGVSGTISLGDPTLATPLGTFAVTGVHNPSTGGLTLVPGLWTDTMDTKLTFFVDGTHDPTTKKYEGDMLTNIAACPADTWKSTFD